MLITRPRPSRGMCGSASRVIRTVLSRFSSNAARHASSSKRVERRERRTAGIVDEDVDAAELTQRRIDESPRLLGRGHVDRNGEHARAAVRADRRGRLLELSGIARADHDACPFAGERLGARAPEPFARREDERDAAVQSEIHGVSFPADVPIG